MNEQNQFFMNISQLHRNTQKYFDKQLLKYNIGAGQFIFLVLINENEGITMQELTNLGGFDKGTTTKGIQKLVEQDYLQIINDDHDRRVKHLYTSSKANNIMGALYEIRNNCHKQIAGGLSLNDFNDNLNVMTINSNELEVEDLYDDIKIGGIQKMTLLDYPGLVAATLFTVGCNFKCPYCHNKELVFPPENYEFVKAKDVMEFLKKRQGLLDGVCISGGEPLLQNGLMKLIKAIKELGYKIKLDTNGYYPDKLKEIIESGYIDYVAMDIKNSPDSYSNTVGVNDFSLDIENIKRSVAYLMNCGIDYEFRTTIVKELHNIDNIEQIGKWLKGCKHYYLQQYIDSENVIKRGFTSCTKEEMEQMVNHLKQYINNVELRGTK